MNLEIPQTNPRANYLSRKIEIDQAIAKVMDSGWYILGREVAAFEQEFAAYNDVRSAVGVASGTDAIQLSLRACGVGPGDYVLTVPHTAVATAAAISMVGANPIFVDIDRDVFTMDPNYLEDAISKFAGYPIKAVVPVHIYGHPCDISAIVEIAKRHSLFVVEDCAQSHGASWNGKKTGSFGHMAAFSFYPTKNLGALGDGGMVVTGDREFAERVRLLREYGWEQRYVSKIKGVNSRLDELQAAVLRIKLRYLDVDNDHRRRLAGLYQSFLAGSKLELPQTKDSAVHVFHQYVIRSSERDALRAFLRSKGTETLIHYPIPVHKQPAYTGCLNGGEGLSRSEEAAGKILSLPMYPELTESQVQTVAMQILSFIDHQ